MSRIDWFNEARYGMFIHWGPYAVAGRGEWVMNRERVPADEYINKYCRNWKAENYDPNEWCRIAKAAGMKYIVLTTRHHDGFALWGTETTDYNAVKMGPKRDLVAPYVEAVRKAGLKLGFYFSPADWMHPDYPTAFARDWRGEWHDEECKKRYIPFYRAQVRELMTQYGEVDLLWWDGAIPQPMDGDEANAEVRSLQPNILINDRNGAGNDFCTSEQVISPSRDFMPWEACMTLNDNWGYHAGDHHWKTAHDVIYMLTITAKSAGNLLLNVGPKPDGTIPLESVRILEESGDWLRRNPGWLANSTRKPFTFNAFGPLTTKGNRIYFHMGHGPGPDFCLAEIKNRVLTVKFLESGKPVEFKQDGDRLHIKGFSWILQDPIFTTLIIECDGEPEPIEAQNAYCVVGA